MNRTDGAAVVWKDGSKQYYINGRSVPSWVIEERDSITRERFLKEPNSDVRGAIYEVLGQQKMFDLLGAVEVSRSDKNGETVILYETPVADPQLGKLKWVGVECPSTATKYLLGVEPQITDPIEGVASTFGMSKEDYLISQHT